MSDRTPAGTRTYLGLFLVALATLMYEILLTRIFSVTMWYHFAFMAISVAMFGMTAGALLVYLAPGYFTEERTKRQLAQSALAFSIALVLSFLTHLSIPFVAEASGVAIFGIVLTYLVVSIPFVFSGVCVCLALTRFPRQVSKLYAADLSGAGLGCVLLVYLLKVTDGPSAVFAVAVLASAAAALFASEEGAGGLARAALWVGAGLAAFVVGNTALARTESPLVQLIWTKGARELPPLYEKWNSFSRIKVVGDPRRPEPPFGWGLSQRYHPNRRFHHLHLNIDATAGTVITRFAGDLGDIEDLGYDVTNVVHHLRHDADVLVVGSGGGRDILAALQFRQRSVTGVEINEDIIHAVNGVFGDFSGHLDQIPDVRFVADEARSYVARTDTSYDIIQISLIDTWAATAAGAFVLAENSLYTTEAWETFLRRLKPGGVLSVSRWYFRERPAEVYRLASLARESLLRIGVQDPRAHIIIVRSMLPAQLAPDNPDGLGTILVSPQEFTPRDLVEVERVARQMGFKVELSPRRCTDIALAAILSPSNQEFDEFAASFPVDVTAPTDDSPFFFHVLRLRDVFRPEVWNQGGQSFNISAVVVLGVLLIITLALTVLCTVVPVRLTLTGAEVRRHLPLFVFFAAIGFGFMFVEISQMQRLIIFLGHPTYGLSVVLFSLLVSSGLGSLSTSRLDVSEGRRGALLRFASLLAALIAFGLLTPHLITWARGESTPVRILLSVAILAPLGFLMGMAFPIGMKLAAGQAQKLTPCLWGINGATSVCASVLAVVVALGAGITASFWTGFGCYVVGVAVIARRGKPARAGFLPNGQGSLLLAD